MATAVNDSRAYDFPGGQFVAYTGTAGSTTAFGNNVEEVLVSVTSAAYIRVGATATAGAGSLAIAANTPIRLRIAPGEIISAIQQSAGGNLCVIPCR